MTPLLWPRFGGDDYQKCHMQQHIDALESEPVRNLLAIVANRSQSSSSH